MSTKEIGDMADSVCSCYSLLPSWLTHVVQLLAAVEGAENNISAVNDALQVDDAP